MVFNSLAFLVFFAVVFAIHSLPLPWTLRKVNLLLASYVFYAAWNPPFVLLLVLAAVVDFFLSRLLGRIERPATRKLLLIISLVMNLGLLSYFKYGGFLLENFTALMSLLGVEYKPAMPSIVLPLGISFYTFETISYLIDVYRRRISPWSSFLDYALFLTFFPHLVAGPIVRAADFLPQCLEPKRANARQIGWGLSLLTIGLFEKVVLADGLMTPVSDLVFNHGHQAGFIDAWIGTLAFSGQIFFDFSGYSLCAIGVALTLGFVLKSNFHFPYSAIGFTDFWKRWHVSLSSWLRDYLYISLGGNRASPRRTNVNLMLTMLLGGIWHGASWRFVAWGGFHGACLIGERVVRRRFERRSDAPQPDKPVSWTRRIPPVLLTFVLVCVGWVFFRAQDFPASFHVITTMFAPLRPSHLVGLRAILRVLVVMGILVLLQIRFRDQALEGIAARVPPWARALALGSMLLWITLSPGDDHAFIYFQF